MTPEVKSALSIIIPTFLAFIGWWIIIANGKRLAKRNESNALCQSIIENFHQLRKEGVSAWTLSGCDTCTVKTNASAEQELTFRTANLEQKLNILIVNGKRLVIRNGSNNLYKSIIENFHELKKEGVSAWALSDCDTCTVKIDASAEQELTFRAADLEQKLNILHRHYFDHGITRKDITELRQVLSLSDDQLSSLTSDRLDHLANLTFRLVALVQNACYENINASKPLVKEWVESPKGSTIFGILTGIICLHVLFEVTHMVLDF